MNTLGKILVFINLLFSLITGALIIMVFITRSQWQAGYGTLQARFVRERESHIATINARNDMAAKKEQEIQAVTNEKKGLADRLALAEKTVLDEKTKRLDAQRQVTEKDATIEKLKAMNENREAEVKKIDGLLAEAIKENVKLVQSNKELAEKKVEFEIKYLSTKERNEQLVIQVQNLLKENEQMRLGNAARSNVLVRNPPPEDIKGRVKATDQSGLVTINLGSDSGLSKGNTLEVFRLAPKPTYLGTLRITDVRPNEAVGRLVSSNRRGGLQVGDEVASEILGRR
jgi:hypothetical protein